VTGKCWRYNDVSLLKEVLKQFRFWMILAASPEQRDRPNFSRRCFLHFGSMSAPGSQAVVTVLIFDVCFTPTSDIRLIVWRVGFGPIEKH
jgi:hypothetical protein